MKKANKNLLIASAIIMISPLLASADSDMVQTTNSSSVFVEQNEYSKYYSMFKGEFYNDLEKGIFSNIDNKIKGYKADADYLKSNPDSPYYNNYAIYELKAKVLEDLKNNFSNFKQNLPVVKEDVKNKIGDIMRSLEEELKTLRESITKENLEEVKAKAEVLKKSYEEKVSSLGEEAKKMLSNRFEIFFKNQFVVREEVKKVKDDFINKAELAKKQYAEAIEKAKKAKELTPELKQNFKTDFNNLKSGAKEQIEKIKTDRKDTVNNIRNEQKDLRQDLKMKYKNEFISKLKDKLDTIPQEKLQIVLDNIAKKREQVVANTKLTQTNKDKLLAQLDALTEIINEKLGVNTEENINVEELLNVK